MGKVLVSGVINMETTLAVEQFPVEYSPVNYKPFGIRSQPAAVGYNLTKALTTLGTEVNFVSMIGRDMVGALVRQAVTDLGVSTRYMLELLEANPQSVILYDKNGQRQINTDLKDVAQQTYDLELFGEALDNDTSLAALTNVNFSRPLLASARQRGLPIATDLHALANLDDEYNQDFMRAASIIFLSHERLPGTSQDCARALAGKYGTEIIVIGLGNQGALLYLAKKQHLEILPALTVRPVVNTIGAGDALFAAFLHFYNKKADPKEALKKAILFASYKIGEIGASEGFLTEELLEKLYKEYYQ